jgi:hypothetical protein
MGDVETMDTPLEKCCDEIPKKVFLTFCVYYRCKKCGFMPNGCIIEPNGDYENSFLVERWNEAVKQKALA